MDDNRAPDAPNVDPEVDSQFARTKAMAKERGTAPGVDPETGERASISYRQLYNEMDGDGKRAAETFREIAKAGGFGDVDLDQTLDIRSLSRSVEENKRLADRAEDRFDRDRISQQAQHQDNLVNAVGKLVERIRKG